MPNAYLTSWLVMLPAGAAIAFLVGATFVPDGRWESVFVELFATALGVLVTALYVDRIVRGYDERRWEGATRLGYERAEFFAAWTAWAFIAVVQSARVGPAARELSEAMGSGDRGRYRAAMADLMTSNVAPALPVAMRNMDRDAWVVLSNGLRLAVGSGDLAVGVYADRLNPAVQSGARKLHHGLLTLLGLCTALLLAPVADRERALKQIATAAQDVVRDGAELLRAIETHDGR